MSVGLGLYATSHRGVPRAAIAMESSTVDLVVYDGLESLHRGLDCTPATSTKPRRLVLGSGRTVAEQDVRCRKGTWAASTSPCLGTVGEEQRRELVFELG